MSIGEHCNRDVVVTTPDTSISEAARLMREHHVGDLIVVERDGVRVRPVGIFTDRDIVVELIARDVPFDSVAIRDVMSFELTTGHERDELRETLRSMSARGVRRLPVVDDRDDLVGILAIEDVLKVITESLVETVRVIRNELETESERRP